MLGEGCPFAEPFFTGKSMEGGIGVVGKNKEKDGEGGMPEPGKRPKDQVGLNLPAHPGGVERVFKRDVRRGTHGTPALPRMKSESRPRL